MTMTTTPLSIQVRTDEVEARLRRALDVVRWLHAVSALSDGCCRLVCEMLDVSTLVRLMEVSSAPPPPPTPMKLRFCTVVRGGRLVGRIVFLCAWLRDFVPAAGEGPLVVLMIIDRSIVSRSEGDLGLRPRASRRRRPLCVCPPPPCEEVFTFVSAVQWALLRVEVVYCCLPSARPAAGAAHASLRIYHRSALVRIVSEDLLPVRGNFSGDLLLASLVVAAKSTPP